MRRPRSPHPLLAVALVIAGAAAPAHPVAQTARSAPPRSPDLLGIYMGMPAEQAKAQLQKHSSDVYVQYASDDSGNFGMSVPGAPTDDISVSLTRPPNTPAVWRIERRQSYPNGARTLPKDALVAALHQKYGKETIARTPDSHVQLYWIYDANGQLRTQADPALTACDGIAPSVTLNEIASRCAQEFYALYVDILGDSVQSYTMVLINRPLEARAAKSVSDSEKAAQDRAPKAPQQKAPTF
jgi:hypothetical protein